MNDFNDLISTLPPGALEQLLGLGTLDERGAMLDRQLAQAEALRQSGTTPRSTGLGALGSGLAGAINQAVAGAKSNQLRGEQTKLLSEKDRLRLLAVKALLGGGDGLGSPGIPDLAGLSAGAA